MATIKIKADEFPVIEGIYAKRNGLLNKNNVVSELYNKIALQKFYDTFGSNAKIDALIQKYMNASQMYGDTDEIVGSDIGHRQDFKDSDGEWTKEKYIPKQFVVWAEKLFEDQYFYTIKADQMAKAMKGASQLGGFLSLIAKGTEDKKFLTWYDRIRHYHMQYEEIVIEPVEGENISITIAKRITKDIIDLQQPNTMNKKGKTNLYSESQINLTLNTDFANEISWEQAKIFNGSSINYIGKILDKSATLNYGDPSVACVLDTNQTLYFGDKYKATDFFHNASDKYTNYYLHETYSAAFVDFHTGRKYVVKAPVEPETKVSNKKD